MEHSIKYMLNKDQILHYNIKTQETANHPTTLIITNFIKLSNWSPTDMGLLKPCLYFGMIFVILSFASRETTRAEARPLPLPPQQKYSKIFATLGVVCQCCDGAVGGSSGGGECKDTWVGSCSKLRCLPWKLQ
ncbi:uncharacterized protein LOC111369370 [Olea europaea var. sylvestris]|uniref:uncharacterized protein LOC111369370 n=1 Tax=Olea europaea var. sylvestris TaxID=158386 RepID=UPI000C1D1F88|nr:uncharacterized protein LOC111369370 [Olea europaea var. sylvestris]